MDRPRETSAPDGYGELLEQLKTRVLDAQLRAVRSANIEVLTLYWSIGRDIVDRQDLAGWGARVVDRLAADLRAAFPDQRGWSRSNLMYMRAFAAAWTSWEVLPTAVGQLPRGTRPRPTRQARRPDRQSLVRRRGPRARLGPAPCSSTRS